MSYESTANLKIVQGLYAAFAGRDLETIRAAIHPEFVMRQSDLLPWGGRRRGPDGFLAFLGTLLSHVDPALDVEALYDAGDHIVQFGYSHGTVIAHGTPFRVPEVHVWQLRDGLITSYQVYVDVPAVLAALTDGNSTP
ncbi:nuclear transport factor 2 family protein [Nonomuraea sp. NPDC050547]|uniref:nuclear transport factor 2 family protein n=1 Tax=Nonomuraea sp. NPDC050547 TaxID=3364368 RepID=UPI0037A0ABD3